MDVQHKHNVRCFGSGPVTLVFGHGFGCDQHMWRFLTPAFQERFKIVLYDLVGSGHSQLSAYNRIRYASLQAHADDLLDIIDACTDGPLVFIGHSVSAMIGMLAGIAAPERFEGMVMVCPSPCYLNDDDYVGGFNREDMDVLLELMENNYRDWAERTAPAIMGEVNDPALRMELADSFCRNDPEIAKHFARVTFLSDLRSEVPKLATPTLILQCVDDLLAPREVGQFMHEHLQNSTLGIVYNVGHCPHMSAPSASTDAINLFLAQRLQPLPSAGASG